MLQTKLNGPSREVASFMVGYADGVTPGERAKAFGNLTRAFQINAEDPVVSAFMREVQPQIAVMINPTLGGRGFNLLVGRIEKGPDGQKGRLMVIDRDFVLGATAELIADLNRAIHQRMSADTGLKPIAESAVAVGKIAVSLLASKNSNDRALGRELIRKSQSVLEQYNREKTRK